MPRCPATPKSCFEMGLDFNFSPEPQVPQVPACKRMSTSRIQENPLKSPFHLFWLCLVLFYFDALGHQIAKWERNQPVQQSPPRKATFKNQESLDTTTSTDLDSGQSRSYLRFFRPPYVWYGVKYIDLVILEQRLGTTRHHHVHRPRQRPVNPAL